MMVGQKGFQGRKLTKFRFGLSGFPSRKENGLLSPRFLREKQSD